MDFSDKLAQELTKEQQKEIENEADKILNKYAN